MFRRRRAPSRPEPQADGPRDPELAALSVPQAAALVELALGWFGARNVSARYESGVVVAGGIQYGLHNLAASVHVQPWRDWPAQVERHFTTLRDAGQGRLPATLDELLLKLRPARELPEPPEYDSRCVLPGLHALFAQDTPTAVHEILRVEALAHLGDLDAVRARATANMVALPVPEHTMIHADPDRTDAAVHVFAGRDFFVASRVLVLRQFLATTLGVEAPSYGCLVAVPNRHLLVVHMMSGAGVVAAVRAIGAIAIGESGTSPGAISDEVYFLPPHGPGQSVLRRGPDAEATVQVDGAFGEAFRRLGLTGG